MPIYEFFCECGNVEEVSASFAEAPPLGSKIPCSKCKGEAARELSMPEFNLSDPDPLDIPPQFRVSKKAFGDTPRSIQRKEKRYAADIEAKRKLQKQASQSVRKPRMKLEYSFPPEFVQGKIRQTGDPNYFKDPKNRAKHREFKVS